ncbi:flagellar export protein FliJ [Fictibacillus sp. KIGAM418]|uniref:Flagellar FliJ protein n=1 Tax=Fictibacillus marinisediminis TaxID=2878389 RepID=A0A9X1XAL2_9BACL|nr:flagellar export protein FliJ [Fictibacillus marinisediminis]MCK6257013.1 flagellar export protein FliJ [Fictibacillus marinisediminis]
MAFQFKMEKILALKTKEKEAVESEYGESVRMFESLAKSLYDLLRKKEEIEQHSDEQFRTRVVINELQQTQRFLLSLTQKISMVQSQVQKAREIMNITQQELVEKTIEVKKYEKLKEKQHADYQRFVTGIENQQNDEFSILRYINQ